MAKRDQYSITQAEKDRKLREYRMMYPDDSVTAVNKFHDWEYNREIKLQNMRNRAKRQQLRGTLIGVIVAAIVIVVVVVAALWLIGNDKPKDNNSSAISTTSSDVASSSSVTSSSTATEYPYVVDVPSNVAWTFKDKHLSGDLPEVFNLHADNSGVIMLTILLKNETDGQLRTPDTTYSVKVKKIPTKTLQVNSASNKKPSSRVVKVNTEIILGKVLDDFNGPSDESGNVLYMFPNKWGSISFLYPSDEASDNPAYQEYLQTTK
ncbi:hypothetical protein EQG49_07250 [Periweissella cryptocerci]|uniref:Uncharacterized protein n=1 Tax=Periweissella cryptocerci TaxID=2506420 RepID=A0A4P6YU84_9LACO|nr:hypothetical protein [Periweissella cryptocerci]QBO36271.1 hypothetical protein EQG49_07250 [Periweissella cryptocerci]